MTFPFALPDWLPWWVPIVLLVPLLLYALAFLFMPFSVIGLKSRLDVMEARLDEIQGEIRHLSLRLPAAGRIDYDEVYAPEPTVEPPRRGPPVITRPPIPPAPHDLDRAPRELPQQSARAETDRRDSRRAEPRLDWPR